MLRIWTDMNARSEDGYCLILKINGRDVKDMQDELKLMCGQKVTLFQDEGEHEDDFEVIAELRFGYLDIMGKCIWFALPDFNTLRTMR